RVVERSTTLTTSRRSRKQLTTRASIYLLWLTSHLIHKRIKNDVWKYFTKDDKNIVIGQLCKRPFTCCV
ncbi:hypothetical protein PO909_026982, partial [Leuciscus waleckii]